MTPPDQIGENVRRRRLARGVTLEQLAEQSGVSPAMISEVERDLKNPTVRIAYQLARALGCTLTELLEDGTPTPRVVRAAERRTLIDAETGVERHGLSPEMLRHGLDLVWYVVPPGETVGAMTANRPGILEHLTVVRGTLTLLLGRERHRLRVGDGITYGPQATIEYRNQGRGTCEFMLVADTRRAS
jgi:transcriptional regulator with XRE-family HTH domain